MEALPGCVSESNPARYDACTLPEYMEGWYKGQYTTMRSLTEEQVAATADTDLSGYADGGGVFAFEPAAAPAPAPGASRL
jgi:hypothetical protein|eukprot:COSAG06_NODE_4279_length_4407_cov_3.888579_3_plen_80_part_00